MASTDVRVSEHTHELLRKLAASTGEPPAEGAGAGGRDARREQFFVEHDAAYARLQADPVAWADELAELGSWRERWRRAR